MKNVYRTRAAVFAASIALAGGCEGSGNASILIEAEDTITHGLVPGSGLEDVVDGWTVTFDTYVVGLSGVTLARSSGGAAVDDVVHVVDLKAQPPGGSVLTSFGSLSPGRYDLFSYRTVVPTVDADVDSTVSSAERERMTAEGCAYLLHGTLEKPDGQSCPPRDTCRAATTIAFDLCVPATVDYSYCTSDTGLPGLPIASGSTATASITIHGDHLFFDGFPGSAEVVRRRAQWLADADVDANGEVTRAELAGITAASGDLALLLPSSEYNLTGSPVPLTDAWSYVRAELVTQGHFQGEGECAREVR